MRLDAPTLSWIIAYHMHDAVLNIIDASGLSAHVPWRDSRTVRNKFRTEICFHAQTRLYQKSDPAPEARLLPCDLDSNVL